MGSTVLVMEFPGNASLPSRAELVANFGRFGSLINSLTKVSPEILTCYLAYAHKADAEAACKAALGYACLFGSKYIVCYTREQVDGEPLNDESGNSESELQFSCPACPKAKSLWTTRCAHTLE